MNDTFRSYGEAAAGWLADTAEINRDPAAALHAFGLHEALADSARADQAAILAAVGLEMGKALVVGPLVEVVTSELCGLGSALHLLSGFDPLRTFPSSEAAARRIPYAEPGRELLMDGVSEGVPMIGSFTLPSDGRLACVRQVDGTWLGLLANTVHPPTALLRGDDAQEATRHVMDLLLVVTSARLLGIAEQCMSVIRDHLNSRVQFGKTLSSFQALQHSVVDAHIEVSLARALLDQIVERWTSVEHRESCAFALKAQASGAARSVCRKGVQLLGAMGFTDEGPVAPCLKHTLVLAARYGSEARCRAAYRARPVNLFG